MAVAGEIVYASEIDDLEDYTIRRPLVRLIATSSQSISNNTNTAILFGSGSEDIDTHGFHDTSTNTSRITPNVAGYYEFGGTVFFGSRADYTVLDAWIRGNGSTNYAPAGRTTPPLITGARGIHAGTVMLQMNGTTDYMELMGFHTNSAAAAQNTNQSGQFASVFWCKFLRPV